MTADAALPDVPGPAVPILVLLLGCLWLHLRVASARRLEAIRLPDEPPPKMPGWLRGLARSPWTTPVLGVVAGLLAVALVLVYRSR